MDFPAFCLALQDAAQTVCDERGNRTTICFALPREGRTYDQRGHFLEITKDINLAENLKECAELLVGQIVPPSPPEGTTTTIWFNLVGGSPSAYSEALQVKYGLPKFWADCATAKSIELQGGANQLISQMAQRERLALHPEEDLLQPPAQAPRPGARYEVHASR